MLGLSGKHLEQREVDLSVLTRGASASDEDGGVADGGLLLRLCDAVLRRDRQATTAARDEILQVLGAEALVDAAAVIAAFEANDRVADATGIPLDEGSEDPRRKIAAMLGVSDGAAATD